MREIGHFIGGKHVKGTSGRTSDVFQPMTGEVIGKLDHDEPGVLVANLDLAEADKARAAIPALANARAFTGP